MEKIASFTVDHSRLSSGCLYCPRKDHTGQITTAFRLIRMALNFEPVLNAECICRNVSILFTFT